MKQNAQLNRCIENMEHYNEDAKERANVQGTRAVVPLRAGAPETAMHELFRAEGIGSSPQALFSEFFSRSLRLVVSGSSVRDLWHEPVDRQEPLEVHPDLVDLGRDALDFIDGRWD
jgi:hypothetical protein